MLFAKATHASGEFGNGDLKEVPALHPRNVFLPLVHLRRKVGAASETAARNVDAIVELAIRMKAGADEAGVTFVLWFSFAYHHRRRAVAEEHREAPMACTPLVGFLADLSVGLAAEHIPVFPWHESGVGISAHDENGLGSARAYQAVGDLECVRYGSALLTDVQGGHAGNAEFGAEQAARAGKDIFRRHGGHDDEIDIFRFDIRVAEGALGRLQAKVTNTFAFLHKVPLGDAGSWTNPLVAGVHDLRQGVVGNWLSRDMMSGSDDGDTHYSTSSARGASISMVLSGGVFAGRFASARRKRAGHRKPDLSEIQRRATLAKKSWSAGRVRGNYPAMTIRIALISTGGTIEKTYDEHAGTLSNRSSIVQEMLRLLRLEDTHINTLQLMSKDSLEFSDSDRKRIAGAVDLLTGTPEDPTECRGIIILHGTDTLCETGEFLYKEIENPTIPIILTGAMRPFEMKRSDALQNLNESIFATGTLEPGIYVVAHGKALKFPGPIKDRERGTFVNP